MPRSGGIFSLIPGYFATDGTTIEVSQHNPVFEDVAQALTDSLPRDGSAPMTGNLAMGSNKITGLAAATNPADAVRFDQLPTVTPTNATITAGTDVQGQGPITTELAFVTSTPNNPSGVTLPVAVAGQRVWIANRGSNPINIYPALGTNFMGQAVNTPQSLGVNQSVEFFARSATQWTGQISQPLDADLTAVAGLSTTGLVARTAAGTMATRQITSADGSVTITNPAGVAGDIDLSAGGRVLLATKTASASATLNFTEFNNALYRYYEFVFEEVRPATDNVGLYFRTSTNGGSSYDSGASDYNSAAEGWSAGGPAGAAGLLNAGIITRAGLGNAAGETGVTGEATLFFAGDAAKRTRFVGLVGYDTSSGVPEIGRFNAYRVTAQDTDAIQFLMSSGNITSGTIRMYGAAT